jgi:Subtilase family
VSARTWVWWGLGVIVASAACHDPDTGGGVEQSPLAHRNVMVIDDGIDETVSDLRGKIIGSYTISCASAAVDPTDAGTTDAGAAPPSFDVLKKNYLAELAIADQSCELRPGIAPKADPLPGVAPLRDRWNAMIRGQKFGDQVFTQDEWNGLMGVFAPVLQAFAFHGTTTAGTVAHDNPDVRLVLVERSLGEDATRLDDFQCLVQSELDQWVALLGDPEVRDAYIHAPDSRYTTQLGALARELDVGLVNESYGVASRLEVEELEGMKGCAPVDVTTYYETLEDVRAARLAAAPAVTYLVVQSAGNDGREIDSGADSTDCLPEDPRHFLVGSTTVQNAVSRFSNFGACVTAFAPGEHVIAPYAGGWLFSVQGTSYSAPLVTRLLSLTAREPFDAEATRTAFLKTIAGTERVPTSTIPRDFFYAPAGLAKATSALTLGPALPSVEVSPTRSDLRPIVDPLRALRAALRRR